MVLEPVAAHDAVAVGGEVEEIDTAAGDVGEAQARLALGITPDGTDDRGAACVSTTRLFFRSIGGHGSRPRYSVTHSVRGLTPRLWADS